MTVQKLLDVVAIQPTDQKDVYESVHKPETMANAGGNIGYGGGALAVACMTAHQGVPENFRIYSMVGNFLGPAFTDRKLYARFHEYRRTRSFITRQVILSQKLDNGGDRDCLIALCDFHAIDTNVVMTFSKQPCKDHGNPDSIPKWTQNPEDLLKAGKIDDKIRKAFLSTFQLNTKLWATRPAADGVSTATLASMAPHLPSKQDHLPMAERWSADWFRSYSKLEGRAENFAALAWKMDGGLSFQPLIHGHKGLRDVNNASTLEFALRFFSTEVDMNEWNVRECRSHSASNGRSYSEGLVWDRKGNLLASMTQQCSLRAKRDAKI